MTGPANCKKTTRHNAHLPLCAKSRGTNDAKTRKWQKPQFGQLFEDFKVKLQFFFPENRFHSNWRSYLVLTSGQKPKKLLEPFLRKISQCLIFGLIWRPFRESFQIKTFFSKIRQALFYLYSLLTSCKNP